MTSGKNSQGRDAMKKLLYADDLTLVANGKEQLHDTLEEWNRLFNRQGLKRSPEKAEVLHIDHQREELGIEFDGKNLTQGVMADRLISKRLKGKVMSTCVTPACLNGTETLALTEVQQQRLQMCENNWVRKIARVEGADRRRMVESREETGVQTSLTESLARSRLQWAGHIERMADDSRPKRAEELREEGRRR